MQHLIYRLSQGLKRNSRLYLLLTRIKYKRLSGDGNEDGQKKKISRSNYPPPPPIKKTLHVSTLFLCISFRCCFFARLQLETSRNFLVTHFLEEMSYVLLFTFFFHYRSFSPWWTLEFLIFSSAAIKFPCFSSIVIRSFVFYHSL